MPIRQMKENPERHLVIKNPEQSNTMAALQKGSKASQADKGPPPQGPQSEFTSLHHKCPHPCPCPPPPPAKNKGRRRGRGARKPGRRSASPPAKAPAVGGGAHACDMEVGFPTSSKLVRFPGRPGFGQVGTRCVVKANHFVAELPDKDLIQYDVTITPPVASRNVSRAIMSELVKLHRESDLGMRLPAYDGRKSLYTAGELPFTCKEFCIKLVDEDDGTSGPM